MHDGQLSWPRSISSSAVQCRRERQEGLKLYAELSKQGSNLNQIARAINTGRVAQLSQSDMEIFKTTQAIHGSLIKRLGKTLS